MKLKYSLWSFYLCLFCLLSCCYYVLSQIYQLWMITLPSYILLTFSIIAFFTGIIGLREINGWTKALRSWFTILISFGLSFIFTIAVLFSLFVPAAKSEMFSSISPDHHYKIHLYLTNGGATTSYGVRGELDGPLWFNKTIYNDYKIDHANVKWINNYTVKINGKVLNLKKGEIYDFRWDSNWVSEYH